MMKKVLFLCIKNSARSQMAEGILNSKAGDRFEAYSAGSKPSEYINRFAIKVMQEADVDLSEGMPELAEKYLDVNFDFVITLCDKMKEQCPHFPGDPIVAHWGMPDPDEFQGSDEEKLKEFRKTRNEIFNRIVLFISLPMEKLDRLSIVNGIKEIGF
ncbi:MAG: arsenate reductase ArsC [Clostridiaceae bacterium]|nr:arsenate reductase ArsC [Clostridiaceae bacterium]